MAQTPPPSGTVHLSSPRKPLVNVRDEIAWAVYADVTRDVSEDEMWKLLGYSKDEFMQKYKDAPTKESVEKEEQLLPDQEALVYCKLLNRLSKRVRETLQPPPTGVIGFFDKLRSKAVVGHPTATECCPDFIAVSYPAQQEDTARLRWQWSELEATGEIRSSGRTKGNAYSQAASYTGYLLQARPDLTTVLGMFVDQTGFRLLVTNALGVAYMSPVKWKEAHSSPLLCAWISRLYALDFDETIKRVKSADGLTVNFTITAKDGTKEERHEGCTIYGVGGPFHRRTTVLVDDQQETVFKEQYIEVGRRFEEGPILDVIHAQKKSFPGVVQKKAYSVVQSGTGDLIVEHGDVKRKKTRLVMFDKGERLMDAKTPLEALIAIYDILEVTRFLYTKRGVLHRDISSGNVLLQTEFPSNKNFSDDLGEMCFASFLLKEKASHLNVSRLDTKVLLIDFDMSENSNEVVNKVGKPTQRTGTPIFMARIVRSGMYPEGVCDIPAMPQLEEGKALYEQCVGARLAAFPDNSGKIFRAKRDQSLRFFLHKLRYDAESVFWLLLYWCLLAKPEKDPVPQEIPSDIWYNLTSVDETRDNRDAVFITKFPKKICHSTYAPLDRLLEDMAALLRGDLDFFNEDLNLADDPFKGFAADSAKNSSRLNDEYLHEAFQRLIFNFLFKYYDAEFMKETKSKSYRELEKNVSGAKPLSNHDSQHRSSNQMSRKRKAGDRSGEIGDGSNDAGRDKRVRQDETPADGS